MSLIPVCEVLKNYLWRHYSVWVLVAFIALLPLSTQAQSQKEGAEMASVSHLLFIHHSCGGALLADPGEKEGGEKGSGNRCIYGAHPNGGGLRTLLEGQGYQVNELSYESRLGEDTDIEHWRMKFANHMNDLLRTGNQDDFLPEGQNNTIVAFKSCYPNNDYVGMGSEPGNPDSAERTVANSKAAYNSLLPLFKEQPDVLFVALTPPPRAKPKPQGFKAKIKALFQSEPKDAEYARVFNTWITDTENGWLANYPLNNVVVFDFYDILTDGGKSNWSRYATRSGADSHPSKAGNALAAEVFIPFLAESVEKWEGGTH